MALEAARRLGKPQGSMAKFLKSHLDEIQQLTSFRQAIDDLCIGQIQLLAVSPAMVQTVAAISQQIGLLTNDAAGACFALRTPPAAWPCSLRWGRSIWFALG